MLSRNPTLRHLIWLLFGLTLIFIIVWQAPTFYTVQGLASYLPLHMFAETFSIVVSMLVFGVAWNVYSTERPGNIVILACALLAVGLIDFAHMLSFKGMPDFVTPSGPEKAINLWLVARLIVALALLTVAVGSWQRSYSLQVRRGLLAISLAVAATVIWLGLAYPQAWPRTFIPGQGLTPFKIGAEYAIIAIMLVPAVLFYRQARRPQNYDAVGLFAATVITILSELSFTVYSDVADIFNLLGHLYKIVAYMFIYRAVFVSSVREPFQRLDTELGENQRIAQELRTASLYTRSLIEASLDPLVTISAEGKITDVNKATEDATGRSRSELIGTDFSDCFAEPEKAREGYRQAFLKGHISGYPLVLRHRDGHVTNMLYNASVYQNEKGEVLGVFASARDITERKHTEEALFEAQQIFRTLVENSPDIITRYDRDCRRTYVNPTYLKVAQIPRQELLGSTPAQRSPLPVPSADVLQTLLRKVLDGGEAEAVDVVWPMADNMNHWYNIYAFPEFDREGKVVSVMTVSRDITERKLDEGALRRMNRELSAISNCNQILMRAEDERTLLENICRVVCDDAGYRMAWVGYREDDEEKTIRPVAWAGVEDGYLAQARISWADTERGRGPSGVAIRTGKSACFEDFSTDPNAAPWRESALQRGYRSSISMPLKDESANTFGILTIYSSEPNAFTPDEIRLLEELAADLAFGIIVLRTRIERRQGEAALRESEEKYRTLIQKIRVAVVVHAANTRILVSNSMAQEILGLTEAQMSGKMAIDPAWHFFREDGTAAAFEEYPVNQVLASRQPLRNFVLGVHRADDVNDVWALVNADPVLGEDGRINEIIVTFIDITERKRTEAALRDSEERFRGMFQKHHAVMLLIEPATGKILDVNQAAADYYGYSLEKLKSMAIQDINMMPPEEVALERDKAAREKRNYFVFPHRLANGEIRTVEVHSSPIMVRGKPILFSITHDITARKQAEENLKRMNERFSLASRAARLGVWDWDICKDEMVWDEGMYDLYGIRRADFSGAYEAWRQRVHPDDRTRSDEAINLAQRGEREFDIEFRVVWPDGSIHFLKAYGQLVRDADGKPLRMTGVNFDITERRQAEDALRREQTLLNRIMVTSPVGIAVVDNTGKITFANPQAEKILGLSKEEITQRSYNAPEWHTTAIDGGPFPDEEQPFSRVMAARQPVFDVQHAIEWPDGRRVLLSINGAPIFDAQREIEAVAFAIEDITERKRAEDQLRRSEQSLIESQRMAHLGSWHMDLATNEVYWSEELYKLYGFDPAQAPPLYTESMKLFTPESWESLSTSIARAVETGIPYELELELVKKDGRRGWMLARGELVRDANGAPFMVRGVVMDITERKRVEDALFFVAQRGWQISGENFFDTLAQFLGEKLNMDYVLIDRIDENPDMAETVALYAKGAITPNMRYALKGTPCENVMGKNLCVYSHGIQQLFPEDTLLPGMGAESYIGIPLWDSTGRPIGLIAVMGSKPLADDAPVTQLLQLVATRAAAELERKRAEEAISKLNQELEQRVAERTAQLEAANKELEAFSYSVSHDLRTPLRAIDGFSHILLEDYATRLDEEGKRLLNVVRSNTGRMAQLIDDILKFSRAGRLEITFSTIDMEKLAYSVFVELQPVVVGDKTQLDIEPLPPARGDAAMMRQVFVNLLSNAIKFSHTREIPAIKIGCYIEGADTVYYVKDNGVGFDMQYVDKLFGVFQRLHSVSEFEGTGIGLAIVKRIVTRHGGRVWAEGKVNGGATIYFALPTTPGEQGK